MAKQPEPKHASTQHHEDRREKLKEEHAQQQEAYAKQEAHEKEVQDAQRQKALEEENQQLAQYLGDVKQDDTREMILQRIREMRDEKPKETEPLGRTPAMEEAFHAEQEAGRKAVAKAQEEAEHYRKLREKMEAEEKAKQATTTPVYHPNPGQHEQYPAHGATLGKK